MKTLISNRNHSQQRKFVQCFEVKLFKYLLIFFFTMICHFSQGQNGQEMDSLYIYNDLGERLALDDVLIPQNSGGCNAGFFNLIFTDPGVTGFNNPANAAIRNTVCQVFSDLSVLINPADNPYTGTSNVNNPYVNIRVRTVGMANFLPARGYSNYLIFPGNFYSGVLDGEVWRTINGGVDSYQAFMTFASTAVGNGNGIPPQLFHGNLDFDFTTYGTYNSNFTAACPANEIDVYSLVLQEAFHLLGLNTLLRANGTSAFNPEFFYSRFDSQLRENSIPIINNWFPCDQISYSGQPLTNGCASTVFSGNQALNVPVFSPAVFAINSSLNYLDDNCGGPFMMSPWPRNLTLGVTTRHPEPIEYSILCDLGYLLNTEFGTLGSGYGIYYQYGGTCGHRIGGVDDLSYLNTCNQYNVTSGNSLILNGPSDFILNDEEQNGLPGIIHCANIVSGPGFISAFTPTPPSITYNAPPNFTGYVVIEYIPEGINNELGNFTYIFINVIPPATCQPVCGNNLVNNGDFQNISDNRLFPLDNLISQTGTGVNNTPDRIYFNGFNWVRFDLISNSETQNLNSGCANQNVNLPPSWDNVNTNQYAHLACFPTNSEAIQFEMCAPLSVGKDYTLTFRARIHTQSPDICNTNVDFAIGPFAAPLPPQNTVIGGSNFACGNNYNFDIQASQNVTSSAWQLYSVPFTYTSTNTNAEGNFLIVRGGIEGVNLLIDDITITCTGLDVTETVIPPCNSLQNGFIDLTVEGCMPPFLYNWSNGSTTEDISNLPAGTYTVTVTANDGCTFTETYILNQVNCPYFSITKTAIPNQTYAGAPVDFEIEVCNYTGFDQVVNILDVLPPPTDFVIYPSSSNPFTGQQITLFASPQCNTYHIYGYFTNIGPCTDPGHINEVTLAHALTQTSITDDACVDVLMGCPFIISGSGLCEVGETVNVHLNAHTPVLQIDEMDFDIVYPNFLEPPADLINEFGQLHGAFTPSTLTTGIGTPQPWPGLPTNYNFVHIHLEFTTPQDVVAPPFYYNYLFSLPFEIISPVPAGQNVFPIFVNSSTNGLYHTDVLNSGMPIINGGAWTAANYLTLQYCDGIPPLDASFAVSQIPCDPLGGVTVTANYNSPGIIHNWTWGDNRTTSINGASTFTYNYYDPICDNTGYNFCAPPYNLPPIPPANPGIYTITHTVIDLITGSSSTSTQEVVLYPPCCTDPSYTTIPDGTNSGTIGTNFNGVTFEVQGKFIVNQNLHVVGCNFIMDPASEIIVENGASFTIDGSTLEACSNMWKGIYIEGGGTCTVRGSFIFDAHYAIAPSDGATIGLYATTFDRNFASLRNTPLTVPPYCNTVYHVIDNCTFDCSSNLHAAYTGQSPSPGNKSFAGVDATEVDFDFSGLGSSHNLFKNLSNGIVGSRCNFRVANCDFDNIKRDNTYNSNYHYNGSGIYLRGGHGFFSLNQIGNGISGLPSFNSCYRGIYTEDANITSTDNKMTNMGFGYRVDFGSYMTIDVLNNYIRSDYFGIDLRMNDNARHLLVENNEIHFGSLASSKGVSAINVIEQNGRNNDSRINSNHIWHVLAATNATNGISMTTASNYQVTNNEVNMVNNLNNQKGILTQSCTNDEISCNIINGPGTDYNLAKKDQSAIKVELGDYHKVSCNEVNGTTNGIYFSGYAYNTDVKGNEVNYHKFGLHLDNFAIIGTQLLKGNQWFAAPATGGWGALYENSANAGIYLFKYDNTVSPGATVKPPTWDPAVWFTPASGPNFECAPIGGEDYCEQFNYVACDGCDHEFNFEIAQELIQNGIFTDPSQYELAKQLWKLLDENAVYRNTYSVLNDFYIANQNGLLEKVNEVLAAASNLYEIAPSVEQALQNNKLQLEVLLSSLKTNVDILLDDNSTQAQKMAASSQIQAIQSSILALANYNISAIELVQDSRALSADNVNLVNYSLATSQVFEDNEKQVNEIYLVTIAKGISTFTTQQASTLHSIAIQCPIAGGNAVWKARGMYSLIDDDMVYDDFVSCLNAGVILRETANADNTTFVKGMVQYRTSISPNPTNDKATLRYQLPNETYGTLVLVDSYGKEIYRTALESNSNEFTFSTLSINPSMYFYKVYSNEQLIGAGKISIIR